MSPRHFKFRPQSRNDYQYTHYVKFTQGGISVKDKVVFETNVPVEACLTNAEGKEIGGRRREQVMYDLADGRLMFVPPSIRDQIRKLEVKPGERFQVCKREVDYLRQLDPRAPAGPFCISGGRFLASTQTVVAFFTPADLAR